MFPLTTFAWKRPLDLSRLHFFAWTLSPGILRLGIFCEVLRLEIPTWELQLGILRLRTFTAWELYEFELFRLPPGSQVSGTQETSVFEKKVDHSFGKPSYRTTKTVCPEGK